MTQAEFLLWFGKWKDVVTTGVALAAIAVVVVQVLQAGRFERSRMRREQVAARATLPLTLNALSEYGKDMLISLAPLERWLEQGQHDAAPQFHGPRMPAEIILAVERSSPRIPTMTWRRRLRPSWAKFKSSRPARAILRTTVSARGVSP